MSLSCNTETEDDILNKYIANSPELMKPDEEHLVNSMSVIGSVTVIENGKNDGENFVNKNVTEEPKCVSGEENSLVQINESKEQVEINSNQCEKLIESDKMANDLNEDTNEHKEKENDQGENSNEYDNTIKLINNFMRTEDDEMALDPLSYDTPSSNSDENNEERFSAEKITDAVEDDDNKVKNESSNLSKHLNKVTPENEIFESSTTVDVNVNSNSDKKTSYTKKITLSSNMNGEEIVETGIDMDDVNECPMDIEESGVGIIYSTNNINNDLSVSSNGDQDKCSTEKDTFRVNTNCEVLNTSRDVCNKTNENCNNNANDNNCSVLGDLEFVDLDSIKDGKKFVEC